MPPSLAGSLLGVDRPKPEMQTLSTSQYDLIQYFIVVAALALFASFLRTWTTRNEVSARYRPALVASLCVTAVAAVSYLLLIIKFDTGYDLVQGAYRPNTEARSTIVTRYMDWSVTVPLLTVELLAVCAIAGAKARSLRFTMMAAAFAMIFTGYLGAQVFDDGRSTGWLWFWGLVSTAFYVYLYVALWGAVRSSVGAMGSAASTSLRNAVILLLSVFGVYPLMYAVRVFFEGPEWTTTMQVGYSVADVIAKVGFGALVHKVAKLRTAEDVTSGEDTHPEPVRVSNTKQSEGVQAELKGIAHWPDGASGSGEHAVPVWDSSSSGATVRRTATGASDRPDPSASG